MYYQLSRAHHEKISVTIRILRQVALVCQTSLNKIERPTSCASYIIEIERLLCIASIVTIPVSLSLCCQHALVFCAQDSSAIALYSPPKNCFTL